MGRQQEGNEKEKKDEEQHPRGLGGEERERGRDEREGQWE